MSPLELELQAVKDNLCDMLDLVKSQLVKCKDAIENKDVDLAIEIIESEKKVNIQELAIDRDCENILALYTPVATDLRLVLATLKIANEYKLPDMLEVLVGMLHDMGEALRKNDTKLARKTAKRDEELNEFNKKAFKTTVALIKDHADEAKALLKLFSITRNLERAGDLTKNIAEEIVFHIEAKVLKHQKDNK
jgi:phosphate transport system protein